MKGFHLLKSLIELSQQYVWCVLGKSQLSLYGTPGVQLFYCPDKITFPSCPCLPSSPATSPSSPQHCRDEHEHGGLSG